MSLVKLDSWHGETAAVMRQWNSARAGERESSCISGSARIEDRRIHELLLNEYLIDIDPAPIYQ